jgi:hypothetical protein
VLNRDRHGQKSKRNLAEKKAEGAPPSSRFVRQSGDFHFLENIQLVWRRTQLALSAAEGSVARSEARATDAVSLRPLEVELQRQLHLARPDRRLEDLSEVLIVHCGIRAAEHRMVERILCLDAEFEVHLLAHRELLPQR